MTSLVIAMTTAPRRQPTFERSILSLRAAGFHEDIHVFAEPGTFDPLASKIEDGALMLHQHVSTHGCFGNWKWALEWLLSNTSAPWLLILQDDAIWLTASAAILRAKMQDHQYSRTGFISPYTSPVIVKEEFSDGWNECRAGWGFWGALALCMKRDAAEELLEHPRFARHEGTRQVDAVVAASMLESDRPSFVHVPSLVDHIGATSTIGRDEDSPEGRRGYRFNGN